MQSRDRQIVHGLLDGLEAALRGQEIEQAEAEEIRIRLKEIELALRFGTKSAHIGDG